MFAYETAACVYDGEVYCNGCLPDKFRRDPDEVSPIFADSEWDSVPVCCVCGEEHDYVQVDPSE